ncbi:hypothetical protein [Vibrio sp. McD22-P3]|uniref:hypothetical protein n=1 Tax=Vibrio sp. McD22-P3 TaxID=2724880 RepID=UPI001F317253|nr:hypothetical protein [Vibrio sp. McD22-P3]MCF4174493.1 hypothetical protein [Vibrio sp. McD22-P3]
MIFNTTSSAYYPSGKEKADRRCTEIALQLGGQVSTFFSNVGVEKNFCVPEMDILNRSSNLSIGKADVRCVICEIAANISDTETLLNIASHKASAANFTTRKAHARKPGYKGYHGAVEFVNQIEKLFLSIGIEPVQISKGVYQTVILYSRLILIKLWREGLVVLPITVNLELSSEKFGEFSKFKSSSHRSRPPMFGASDEYCENLQLEFTELINDIGNAPSLEVKLVEREDGKCYDKLASILYCSTLYSPKDVTVSSYDDLTRLFCLYDTYDSQKPCDAHTLKELSNNTMPFKGAKAAFNEFRTAASRLGCHKRESLSGHTHAITNAYRSELLQLNTATQFNLEEVMYEQDEEALFEFFADNDYQSTQEFYNRGLIDEPDHTNWDVYKDKHLSSMTASSSSNPKWGWNVIYQYLGYISCWCAMFPEQAENEAISTPTTLRELDRETFVIRSFSNQDIDTDQWPRTLGEFILRKSVSVATWVKAAINSIETNFRFDNEHVSSIGKLLQPKEFTNAWHKSQRGIKLGSLSESVKNVFTRDEYAVSLQVGYALEKFGSYLQERILEGYTPELLGFRSVNSYHTDNPFRLIEMGAKISTPVGILRYQLHNSPLSGDIAESKPLANVFHWAVPLEHYHDSLRVGENNNKALRRAVYSHDCAGFSPIVWYVDDQLKYSYKRLDATSKIIENPFSMTKYGTIDTDKAQLVAPLLGPIRGIIVALEQGIRHKHIRYLDKRHFDKYVDDANEDGIVQLLVSTDKSRRKPWKASSHIDVIAMLRAEREFQNLRTDVDHLVPYDDKREIDVLFRNASGEAFSELVWSDIWKIFLTISQGIINSSFTDMMESCEFVKMVPLSAKDSMTAQTVERTITADSEFVTRAKVSGKNRTLGFDADGHRVKLLAILTPHSSRTTYVSHRVGYIPIETVSKNIGHMQISTTAYYNRETEEDRARKVGEYRRANLMVVRGNKNKDEIMPMCTSDVSQDQVRESFKQNPRETMSLYGFTSIPIVTVDDDGDEIIKDTGMDLVASTPLSMIAFSSTHICVHNMECPSEIIAENGGYQRCGVCRIKICHVDNLISISRMVQRLELDLKTNVTSLINLNRNKVADEAVHKIEVAQLKRNESVLKSELLGWQAALRIVEQTRSSLLGKKNTNKFVVPAPRLLKESISCETFKMSLAELLLNHMTSMSDVPSLNSPEIQKTVARIEKKILNDSKNASNEVMKNVEACFVNDSLDPRHIMSPIMSMLDANIITKAQILEVIECDLSNTQPLMRSPLQSNVTKALSNG